MELIAQIEACITTYYCRYTQFSSVGRNTDSIEQNLKKLWLAWKIANTDGYEDDGTITCLLEKIC